MTAPYTTGVRRADRSAVGVHDANGGAHSHMKGEQSNGRAGRATEELAGGRAHHR